MINISTLRWSNGIVPIDVKCIRRQPDFRHVCVRNDDAFRIPSGLCEAAKAAHGRRMAACVNPHCLVAEQHPEVVSKLKAPAEKMAVSFCDGSAKGAGVRPPGRVSNPQFLYPVQEASVKKTQSKRIGDEQ